VKELRGFLGLSGYYRKFVRSYGTLSQPLTLLLRKNVPFLWTADAQLAFDALKTTLTTAPVLALPDFTKRFEIETDASDSGVGAVLLQQGHPLAFVSRGLGPRTRGLSTYEKEYMAILLAVEQWRAYLQHAEFVIHTDHCSLSHLEDQRLHTPWQRKVFTKLLGLQFSIRYKKGTANRAADALSRRPAPEVSLCAISQLHPAWLADVVAAYDSDPQAQELLTRLSVSTDETDDFSLRDGVIRYKNKLWLPSNSPLPSKIMSVMHSSPLGGHSGFLVTFCRIKSLFYWDHMKNQIKKFVQECVVCQRAKPDRSRYPGLLAPLPVPDQFWQMVTMDFIDGLPRSGRFNSILVVVDKMSRYAHFIGLSHPYTASTVAAAYMENVHKLHGLPESIVSDRDSIFTSKFWQELTSLAGIQLRMSSSHHPQTDGTTERVNQCLEAFLRCFTHSCPLKWAQWLSLVVATLH
jgi:hypothetical protein